MQSPGCVVVFTKPASPGRVKTRLIGDLSPAQAASLHQAFLDDLLERLGRTKYEVWLAWALDGDDEAPDLGLPALRQEGDDLGERLFRALQHVGTEHAWCAAVGSDHPELPSARLDEAFERLQDGADVVLGPAEDGGYYLVAVGRDTLLREVFADIPWSTALVLETTLKIVHQLGLRAELLPMGHDVDTPDDLPRLGTFLRRHPEECPRTRLLFDRWGLIDS